MHLNMMRHQTQGIERDLADLNDFNPAYMISNSFRIANCHCGFLLKTLLCK
jgi:hypothetical protein